MQTVFSIQCKLLRSALGLLNRPSVLTQYVLPKYFHTGTMLQADFDPIMPRAVKMKRPFYKKIGVFTSYNRIIYPPQKPGDPKRPAEICHMKRDIKYSPVKMWYLAMVIRGLSIDEALKKLSFLPQKGAVIVKQALLDAQEKAVREFSVEYKSNLWIESSFSGKGPVIKYYRRGAKGRASIVHYRYCHLFVRLREGKPPKHYYPPPPTGNEKMVDYIKEQRSRRIYYSL